MKTLEVTGTSYPDAHELPVRTARPSAKRQKSNPGGNSGTNKKQSRVPKLTGKALLELQKADQEQTAVHKMRLLVVNGKRRFVREADYQAM
jgi:hypothetical protein